MHLRSCWSTLILQCGCRVCASDRPDLEPKHDSPSPVALFAAAAFDLRGAVISWCLQGTLVDLVTHARTAMGLELDCWYGLTNQPLGIVYCNLYCDCYNKAVVIGSGSFQSTEICSPGSVDRRQDTKTHFLHWKVMTILLHAQNSTRS